MLLLETVRYPHFPTYSPFFILTKLTFSIFAVFHDESALVQKNSSVIVRRVPGMKQGGVLSQQEMASKNQRYAEKHPKPTATPPEALQIQTKIEGDDEAERIASLVQQSGNTYNSFQQPMRGGRNARGTFRGRPFRANGIHSERAARPSHNYVCHRCNRPGHWIDQCPTNGDPMFDRIKVRAPTGIPRSMLRQVDAPESGTGLQDSSGQFVTLQPNEEEFARQTVGLRMSQAAAAGRAGGVIEKNDDDNAPAADNAPEDKPAEETGPSANASPGKNPSPQEASPDNMAEVPDAKADAPADQKSPQDQAAKADAESKNDDEIVKEENKDSKENAPAPNNQVVVPHTVPNRGAVNPMRPNPPSGVRPPMPPGFPPNFLGMPFPPGFPPPPFLMPMLANGRNGMPPMPPGVMPNMTNMPNMPNMPLPFAPPMNPPSHSGPTSLPETAAKNSDSDGSSHSRRDDASDKDKSDSGDKSSPPREADGQAIKTPDDAKQDGDTVKPDSNTTEPEVQGRSEAAERERSVERDVEHSSGEKIDSGLNSRSPNSPEDNRRERSEFNRRRFDETETDYRQLPPPSRDFTHPRHPSRSRSREPSPRSRWRRNSPGRGPPNDARGSPPRREPWRRDDRKDFDSRKRSDYDSDRERYRPGRYRDENRGGPPPDRPVRDRYNAPMDRRKAYSRRSPSPSFRRGRDRDSYVDSRPPYDRSPDRHRRPFSPGRGRRRDYSPDRRGSRRIKSPIRRRRDGSPGRRRKSRSPSRGSRYTSRSPGGDRRFKRQRVSRPSQSPPPMERRNSAGGSREKDMDRLAEDAKKNGPEKKHDVNEAIAPGNGVEEGKNRSRSPDRVGFRRDEDRRKREREARFADDRGDLKRRRDSSRDQGRRGDDRRDRLSVHDRLGRPPGDRGNAKRRSVIDRLG